MMHRSIQRLVAIGIAAMIPSVALAVNCDQVRRYLAAGRSAQDIADSMIIDVKDVQKCQQQPGAAQQAPDAANVKKMDTIEQKRLDTEKIDAGE
jgi:hypothetical protein